MLGALRSSSGDVLVMASIDGYCSIVAFDEGELGVPLPASGTLVPFLALGPRWRRLLVASPRRMAKCVSFIH